MYNAVDWIKDDIIKIKQYVNPWYKPAEFHREIAEAIEDETNGNLIITVPPQFGKTELLCKTYPAVYVARNPTKTVITASYSQEYVNKLSVQCADFFTDKKFQQLFKIKHHPDLWNKRERLLKDFNGGLLFSGAGGGITGNPADLFLIDDTTKNFEDATSKVKQDSLWNWVKTVAGSRLQGENSRIIIIMTRWQLNDLIGKILKNEIDEDVPQDERFKLIHYGALIDTKTGKIAEKELIEEVANDKTRKKHKLLKSLWPEKKSVKFLLSRYRAGKAEFMTMYQGNPKDLDNCFIKREWIKIEKDIKKYGDIKFSCRGWDFGYTEGGDWTVGSKIDVYEYGETMIPILSDVKMIRKNPTDVKEFIAQTAIDDGEAVIVGLESGGTQIAMASEIMNHKLLYNHNFSQIKPKGDKITRAMPWILKLEDGIFKLAPGQWNKKAIDYLADFSDNCEHDDVPDSITTAWKILFGGAS